MSPEPFSEAQAAHVGRLIETATTRAAAVAQNHLLLTLLIAVGVGTVGGLALVQWQDHQAAEAAQQQQAAAPAPQPQAVYA